MKKTFLSLALAFAPFLCFPQAITEYPKANDKNTYVLKNDSYTLGFNDTYGLPVWSMYRYTPIMKMGVSNVAEEWVTDSRIKQNKTTAKEIDSLNLYKTQMFPREHAMTYAETQKTTYITSNILPMPKSLKEGIWDRITKEIERTAEQAESVYIYSGPVFEKDFTKNKYLLSNRVVQPKYFYRICAYFKGGDLYYKCYKFENHAPTEYEKKCDLNDFLCDLNELESDINIDFFDQQLDASLRKE